MVIFQFFNKPYRRVLSPYDRFTVIGPVYSKWKIKDKTFIRCSFLNHRFNQIANHKKNWFHLSYYTRRLYSLW